MNKQDPANPVIEPTEFRRAKQASKARHLRLSPTLLAVAGFALALAAALLFMLNAKAVRLVTEPPGASLAVDGFFPTYQLGDRHLMLAGTYELHASSPGYLPYKAEFEVSPAPEQEFRFYLTELPGILVVNSATPAAGAEVHIDQQLLGTTPITIPQVPAGRRNLSVTHPRYQPHQAQLNIEGMGKEQSITVTLEPNWANISLASHPSGAQVIVAGEPTDAYTPATLELLAGRHQLGLTKPGYKLWQTELSVKAQEHQQLPEAKLVKSDGKLQVQSTPAGASLTLNDKYYGQTPLEVAIPPGQQYVLALSRAGYRQVTRTLSVESEQDSFVAFKLEPIMGVIRLATSPPGAQLFIDGKPAGSATQQLELPAHKHQLRIALEGYASHEVEVLPQPGFAQQLEVQLQTTAKALAASIPQQITTKTGDKLRLVRPGALTMGASRREPGRRSNEVEREVLLTRPFYIGEHEISNQTFRVFDSRHDSGKHGRVLLNEDDRPVVNVAWEQAVRFCNWLSKEDGLPVAYEQVAGNWQLVKPANTGYRLPTEAEWAWVARYASGAKTTPFPWGNSMPPTKRVANFGDESAAGMVPSHIRNYKDYFRGPAPPGSFPANELGIYDLAGNVSEWANDYYSIEGSRERLTDPTGPKAGPYRVIRGSNYTHGRFSELRWAFRDYGTDPRPDVGFRIARYLK